MFSRTIPSQLAMNTANIELIENKIYTSIYNLKAFQKVILRAEDNKKVIENTCNK